MLRSRNELAAKRRKARHYGVQALYKWHMIGGDPGEIVLEFCDEYDFINVDVEYFSSLLHSISSQVGELEAVLLPILDRKLDELDPIERSVLRLGTFELKKRPDIPYKVVISESVALAKKFGATDSHRYINGVLDKVARLLRSDEMVS